MNKINLKGYDVIRTIFKVPQEPAGMIYIASLTIPFENYSYVINIQAPEFGTTGMRDNVIAMKLLNEGKISDGEYGYEGWFKDPYGSGIKRGVLMNLSEDKKYDADFPDHPLTQTRRLLDKIESEIQFGEELEKIGRFKG